MQSDDIYTISLAISSNFYHFLFVFFLVFQKKKNQVEYLLTKPSALPIQIKASNEFFCNRGQFENRFTSFATPHLNIIERPKFVNNQLYTTSGAVIWGNTMSCHRANEVDRIVGTSFWEWRGFSKLFICPRPLDPLFFSSTDIQQGLFDC